MKDNIEIISTPQNRLMNNAWILARKNAPPGAQKYLLFKDEISHIKRYISWLNDHMRDWWEVDLDMYRDHLLESLAPSSVSAHISNVRNRYKEILKDNEFIRDIEKMSFAHLTNRHGSASPADVRAVSKTFLERMENSLDSDKGFVRGVVKKQDIVDSQRTWLTPEQVDEYLRQIDRSTLLGLRDSALISLALCTGLRRAELTALRVSDLYQSQNGKPVVLVRQGKGCKQRSVPYGEMLWCRDIVEDWFDTRVDLGQENFVFSGINPASTGVMERELPLTTITVKRRIEKYKIGKGIRIRPHDLRRTYARNLYLSGMDIERIRLNMGHVDSKTTRGYIGDLDVSEREPSMIYRNPFE